MWVNDPPLYWEDNYYRLRPLTVQTKHNVDQVGVATRRRGGFGFRPSEITDSKGRKRPAKSGTRKHKQRKRVKRR